MRALVIAVGLALLVHASPAGAADRLDDLAQQLRERPLAIDADLLWFFSSAEEVRLVRALRRSPVDFHVALVPEFEDDESGGDGNRIVASLHQRLGRPGVYLVIDQHGYFSAGTWAIPREIRVSNSLAFPSSSEARTAAGAVKRVRDLVAEVAAAPRGRTTDEPYLSPLEPYENWRTRRYGESTADVALDAAIAGGILGLFAGGLARLRARHVAARPPRTAPPRRRRRGKR